MDARPQRWNPVLALCMALALGAAWGLPFVRVAPNRLLSGEPVFLWQWLPGTSAWMAAALALGLGMLCLALVQAHRRAVQASVALVLSAEGAQALCREAAAVDFVRDAFGHLKAIAADTGAQALLQAAGIEPDDGVLGVDDAKAFLAAACTRQWAREASVRTLA